MQRSSHRKGGEASVKMDEVMVLIECKGTIRESEALVYPRLPPSLCRLVY